MVRGTTPPIICKLKDDSPINLNEVSNIHLTLEQGANSITKREDDLIVGGDGHVVRAYLTQQESLSLKDGKAKIQLNWLCPDDTGVMRRWATRVKEIDIDAQLYRREISA